MPRAKRNEDREMESRWIRADHDATSVSRSESHARALKSESTPPDLRSRRILAREIRPATKMGNENHGGHPDQGKGDKEWKGAEAFDFATCSRRLTARLSAAGTMTGWLRSDGLRSQTVTRSNGASQARPAASPPVFRRNASRL
jgi:hypothetical protein